MNRLHVPIIYSPIHLLISKIFHTRALNKYEYSKCGALKVTTLCRKIPCHCRSLDLTER